MTTRGDITGKTVYILGAGASAHLGAPLLADFLVRARNLLASRADLVYADSFKRVFDWISTLRGSAYYVESDLENLEHVFCLAEMQRQLGLEQGPQVYLDLKRVLVETLDQCEADRHIGAVEADSVYTDFVKALVTSNEERRTRVAGAGFTQDCVITFNYDVFLDYAVGLQGIQVDYGLGDVTPQRKTFRLLKLHGSANWAECQECQKRDTASGQAVPQIVSPAPWGPAERERIWKEERGRVRFRMVTDTLRNTACQTCQAKELFPHVLPPTWSKWVFNDPVARVWAKAVEELQDAFQVIVIGYSLPVTDTFFRYLLTLGLSGSRELHRVVVVNRDRSDELQARYKQVLARNFVERRQLLFSGANDFKSFVSGGYVRIFQTMAASGG